MGLLAPEPLVLVVDDEATVRQALERALRLEGFAVSTAAGGRAALEEVAARPPAVVVLDVMMPDLDGVSVVRKMRADGVDVPVCILSARDEVDDRVAGLQAGADDYLVKPFALAELTARLNALLRRRGSDAAGPLVVGDLVIDPRRHVVTRGGRTLEPTRREFELLEVFARHPGQVLSRDQLLTQVWGYATDVETNVVDVFVGYVRRKLEVGRRAAHAAHRPRGRLGAPAVRSRPASGRGSRSPRSLAVALAGAVAGTALVAAVERDGRSAVDNDLRARVARIAPGTGDVGDDGFGGRGWGPRGRGPERLLVGSGDVRPGRLRRPGRAAGRRRAPNAPPVPAGDGFSTVRIDGHAWRSLTMALGAGADGARLQLLSSLAPVEARADSLRSLVLLIGLVTLARHGARRVGLHDAGRPPARAPARRRRAGERRRGPEHAAARRRGARRGPLARPRAQRRCSPACRPRRRRWSARCTPPAASPPTRATSCARR